MRALLEVIIFVNFYLFANAMHSFAMQTVPLFLVEDENIGLLGARVRAHRLLLPQ
jgi:hypothetical protein